MDLHFGLQEEQQNREKEKNYISILHSRSLRVNFFSNHWL